MCDGFGRVQHVRQPYHRAQLETHFNTRTDAQPTKHRTIFIDLMALTHGLPVAENSASAFQRRLLVRKGSLYDSALTTPEEHGLVNHARRIARGRVC